MNGRYDRVDHLAVLKEDKKDKENEGIFNKAAGIRQGTLLDRPLPAID